MLVPQHLQTNRTAQAALAGRHRVQLSTAAAELLMRFLHSARLALLLALVNEYLEVSVRVDLDAEHRVAGLAARLRIASLFAAIVDPAVMCYVQGSIAAVIRSYARTS